MLPVSVLGLMLAPAEMTPTLVKVEPLATTTLLVELLPLTVSSPIVPRFSAPLAMVRVALPNILLPCTITVPGPGPDPTSGGGGGSGTCALSVTRVLGPLPPMA